MPRQYLNPEGLALPARAQYSHVVRAGNTIYIAGQVARDRQGKVVGIGDAEAQLRQVYANLEIALRSVGGTLANLVKTTTYVVGRESIEGIRRARASLPLQGPPASTLVLVVGLAQPEFLVEVEAIAVLD